MYSGERVAPAAVGADHRVVRGCYRMRARRALRLSLPLYVCFSIHSPTSLTVLTLEKRREVLSTGARTFIARYRSE